MSLPTDEVLQLLADKFVLGHRNIERAEYVGVSHGYKPTQTAVGTTNGAGGRNVQMVVLATDGTVVHVLPGYWHADDLIAELEFALRLHELYRQDDRPLEARIAMHDVMHKAFARRLPEATRARSRWQSFDAWYEVNRNKSEVRDTFVRDDAGKPAGAANGGLEMKPICDLLHERMLAQAFVPFDEFDMESFVDYGRPYYDNNMGLDRGRDFKKAIKANREREQELAKEKARLQKLTPHTR